MKNRYLHSLSVTVGATALAAATLAAAAESDFTWSTVVNNNDLMPTDDEPCLQTEPPLRCFFNSYNQPSVNAFGLVVMRARSRGGSGQPATHGIYTRDMSLDGNPIVRILDRSSPVPEPNNLNTLFVETPAFPRIDMWWNTIATRGNHAPVWQYLLEGGSETRVGTTGIYTNPFGELVTGAAKLGAVPDFAFFAVPDVEPPIPFDVFPGAPAVTMGNTIVFKGNYTTDGVGRTGVFFRQLKDKAIPSSEGSLAPAAGTKPVVLIANNTDTAIPGTRPPVPFGSTSPPSAVGRLVVFAGFDDEANPTLGGIYLAPLARTPRLTPLVSIGEQVPGQDDGVTFSNLGEGVAFDGRYVGFWGAWGTVTATDPGSGEAICVSGCRDVVVHCPTEGNTDRIEFCLDQCSEPNGCTVQVPEQQGIFVHDTVRRRTITVAKTGRDFDEFLFWNFSGKVPGVGQGDEGGEDDGEPARWRSSAFVAVSAGRGATFRAAFKAETEDVVGIYLATGPEQAIQTVLDTTVAGQDLDPEAPVDSTITELGLEREGLRGDWLAISAKMGIEGGTEEEGMAGVYLTRVPTIPRP